MPSLREFEKWLSITQAAQRLGKTRTGVTWLVENRKIRAVKTAIGYLLDPQSVEEYAEKQKGGQA